MSHWGVSEYRKRKFLSKKIFLKKLTLIKLLEWPETTHKTAKITNFTPQPANDSRKFQILKD